MEQETINITPWQYRHDSMRIGIVGASGLGKTTLARDLAEWMQYPLIREGYRTYIKDNKINPSELSDKGIMKLHLELMKQKKALESGKTEFVSDRTPMDLAAYLFRNLANKQLFQRGAVDYLHDAMLYTAMHYDIIFLLPYGQFMVEPDGVRSHDMPALRMMTHMMIESMAFQHGPALLAYQVRAMSVEDRIAECVEVIDKASQVKAKTYAQMTKQAYDKPKVTKPVEQSIQ